jgi:hypothetical protein
VSGATVTLWAAGATGYGSPSLQLASSVTGSSGAFSFHNGYSCPTTASYSQTLYITAMGGSPLGDASNTGSALLYVIGDCSTALAKNPSIVINEVSTVAGMFALAQFFNPATDSFGTSLTNGKGLVNAAATVPNLMAANGIALTSTTATGAVAGYSTAPVVTITPDTSKINTMANIIADCINNPSDCATMFGYVNSTAATDTMQEVYYMATNPTSTVSGTSNIASLYALSTPQQVFVPALGAAPTDWTVGITYGSNSTQTVGSTAVYFMTEPEWVGIDGSGNVWMTNYKTTSATTAGNSLSEISPTGVPMLQTLTAVGQLAGPRNVVIDPSNNIWVDSYGTTATLGTLVQEYTAAGAINTFTTAKGPVVTASDGVGNIYVMTTQGSVTYPGGSDLEFIPAGSASGTVPTQLASGTSAGIYSNLAIDSFNDLWVSNYASTAMTQFICSFSGTPKLATSCTGTTTTAGGATAPQSVSIDHTNDVWIGNYATAPGSLSEIEATNSTSILGASGSPFSGGGLANASYSAIDGFNNLWVSNYASSAGTVAEFNNAGTALSPSTGFAHTYKGSESIAIDGSGNVWIGNAAAASGTANGFITEIVGAAGPVVTPYAANLPPVAGGTVTVNTIGTRP